MLRSLPLAAVIAWLVLASLPAFAQDEPLSMSLEPEELRVPRDRTQKYSVYVGFGPQLPGGTIELAATRLPPGVVARFSPNPLPHQGVAILTIDAAQADAVTNFPIQVLATTRTPTQTFTATAGAGLTIIAQPAFELDRYPLTQNAVVNEPVAVQLELCPWNGFTGNVSLSTTAPQAFRPQLSRDTAQIPDHPYVTLTVTPDLVGEHGFSVTAFTDTWSETRDVTLRAKAEGPAWRVTSIGSTGDPNNCVVTGRVHGQGDTLDRVYAGTIRTGEVWEFQWLLPGGMWQGTPTRLPADSYEIHNMGVGDGRGDGLARLYAGCLDGQLYEMTWNVSRFNVSPVPDASPRPLSPVFHAATGIVRPGDTRPRLYAGRGSKLYEYTYNSGSWREELVGQASRDGYEAHGIGIGPGRDGDPANYLYLASAGEGLFEARHTGTEWRMRRVGLGRLPDDPRLPSDARNVGIGRARDLRGAPGGDTRVRVYVPTNIGMYECTYDPTHDVYDVSVIEPSRGNWFIHAYIVDGRNDGIPRLYSSCADGNVYEFSWGPGGWTMENMGGGDDYMYGCHYRVELAPNPVPGEPDLRTVYFTGGNSDHRLYDYDYR